MAYPNLQVPRGDWLTEATECQNGLLSASTLLSDTNDHTAIGVINITGSDCVLKRGLYLGESKLLTHQRK